MEYKDYYKILGVDKSVGKTELKSRYRKLARQYHPDVNTTDKDAASRFAEISEAYAVLSDDEKRKKYDALGSDWEQYQAAGKEDNFDWSKYASPRNGREQTSEQNWGEFFGSGAGADASEFFRNIFGQAFGGRSTANFARKGPDLHAELPITLEDAFAGGVKVLTVGDEQIRLTLKPGIWDRQTIQIGGRGAPGANGGERGDLYITFLLQPHPDYRLDGTNLYHDLPLGIYDALLGSSQEVKTISGTYEIKIPPETQNGTVFKLKGRGFPIYDKPGSSGDLFLKVQLQLPQKLDAREKALITELAALRKDKAGGERK